MFCNNCGTENRDGAKFCTACGATLMSPDATEFTTVVQPPACEPSPLPESEGAPVPDAAPRSGRALTIVAVLMVVLAVAGVALAALFVLEVGPFAPVGRPSGGLGSTAEPGEPATEGEKGEESEEPEDPEEEAPADTSVEVPSVVGQSEDTARSALEAAGLVVSVRSEHSSEAAEGTVLRQGISAGAKVEAGTLVEIVVSLGPETVVEHRYELVRSCMTWEEARSYCESRGGYLACISSYEEYQQVLAILPSKGLVSCWIGGYRAGDGWAWLDGSDFSYSSWGPGEPYNEDGTENYLTLLKVDGSWSWYDVPNDVSPYYNEDLIGFVMETEVEVPVS